MKTLFIAVVLLALFICYLTIQLALNHSTELFYALIGSLTAMLILVLWMSVITLKDRL